MPLGTAQSSRHPRATTSHNARPGMDVLSTPVAPRYRRSCQFVRLRRDLRSLRKLPIGLAHATPSSIQGHTGSRRSRRHYADGNLVLYDDLAGTAAHCSGAPAAGCHFRRFGIRTRSIFLAQGATSRCRFATWPKFWVTATCAISRRRGRILYSHRLASLLHARKAARKMDWMPGG